MRSLLRNDLRWAWPLAVAGTLFHLIAEALEYGTASIWILPVNSWPNIGLVFHAVGAPIVGLWALAADDLLRTREYRRHRPQSQRRLFWSRHLVGLGVVAAWVLLVPTLHLAGAALFSEDAALIDAGRWWSYVGQGTTGFAFYALAVFLASCAQTIVGGLFAAAAGVTVAVVAVMGALFFGPPSATAWVVGLSLALCPALLLLGEPNVRQAPDPDRPWPVGRLAGPGTGLLVVATLVASAVLSLWQVSFREYLFRAYPYVARIDGRMALVTWSDPRQSVMPVDPQHRILEPPIGEASGVFRPGGRWSDVPMPAAVRNPAFPHHVHGFRGEIFRRLDLGGARPNVHFYAGGDGYIHVYRLAHRDGAGEHRPRALRVGKGSEGRPFSPRTRILELPERTALLVDPTDGVWSYDPDRGQVGFSPVPLPGGDRFAGFFYRGEPSPIAPPRVFAPVAVRGARGIYTWTNNRFEAGAPPDPSEKPQAQVTLRGPVALSVSVTSADGSTFTHEYRPHTLEERALALLQRGSALLRPPLLAPAALLAATDRAFELGPALLLDRPLLLGDRAALAGNLLLSLVLAALTHRRLGRLGVGRGRRLYWTAAVALGGAAAFLCQRWIERARAWRPLPAEPEGRPAPGPLLMPRETAPAG